MGVFVWGMLLLWDIPASIATEPLRDPLMMAHHVGMLVIAGIVGGIVTPAPLCTYYGSFFLGVIEISSIFLIIVDLFHPKYNFWYLWLKETTSPVGSFYRDHVHELVRVTFAVAFLALRAVYFPFLMVRVCLSDFWKAAMLPIDERYGISKAPFLIIFVLALLFTFLQLHWGFLVVKGVIKKFIGAKNTSTKKQE